MAQINTCLKRVFTIFNIFFAIIGGVIIALALLFQALTSVNGGEALEGRTTGLVVLYIVGAVTLVIAVLGAYGAHKESKVSLIMFLVCMVIGSLLMLRAGVPAATVRPQMGPVLEERFRQLLPLDTAREDVRSIAISLQTQLHCCGLFSYQDWKGSIPDSCLCSPDRMEGECRTVSTYMNLLQGKSVYAQTCFPIILHYVLLVTDIMIAVVFTLAALALIGMTLSSIMIHQLRHPDTPAIFMTVPTIFTASPPKYQELHNPPKY